MAAPEILPPLTSCDDGIGVVDFLRGKYLFVTGATGFLSKVLIEKILRTIPTVAKIFLMIKGKDKDDVLLRLKKEIIEDELFKCIKEKNGEMYEAFMMSKLVPVVGNVCEDNIGMDTATSTHIANLVHVIVNSAANTTFDERYDISWNTNVEGPLRVLNFAKKCKSLELLMHISTAYVNGERRGICLEKPFSLGQSINEENIAVNVATEINLISNMMKYLQHDAELPTKMKDLGMKRAIIYGWQNTYLFTKAIGEMVINKERENVPTVIIRPSMITSTYEEPFPGWIQGNRAIDPLLLSYGKGLLPGCIGNSKTITDIVPMDMVVNAIIVVMAKHGMVSKPWIDVYHVSSSVSNPVSFCDTFNFAYEHFTAFPLSNFEGERIGIEKFKFFESIDSFSSYIRTETANQIGLKQHLLTSDSKLHLKDQIEYYKRVKRFIYIAILYQVLGFYKGWFDDSNTRKLLEEMSNEEKNIFRFDVKVINWKSYIKNIHLPALRSYVIKEKSSGFTAKL